MVMKSTAGPGSSIATGAIPLGTTGLLPDADAALGDLVDAAQRGGSWDDAFEAYRTRATTRAPIAYLQPDGRINWTWLTDLSETGAALDLGSPFGEVASNLALDFDSVAYVGAESLHGAVVRRRFDGTPIGATLSAVSAGNAVRLHASRMDLVAFVAAPGWEARLPSGLRSAAALVAFAAGVLKGGGWLGALIPNPYWHPELRRPGGRQLAAFRLRRGLLRALSRGEFRETREYFVAYDLDIPSVYVPATRRAVLQYQMTTHADRARRTAARGGLHGTLFPARLLLARR